MMFIFDNQTRLLTCVSIDFSPVAKFGVSFLMGLIVCSSLYAESRSILLEEVIVTAQKREQNLQDVGISVTAFGSEQIRELGYDEPVDVTLQTPGVTYMTIHQSIATLNIRGISQNDFADHLEPPVALYVDEAYVPHQGAARAQMFDVERVEILRGPQGTLFGRNATGGLMHILSHRPTNEFSGFLETTIGEYALRKFEGAVGGALAEGFRGRLAFVKNISNGWFENRVEKDQMDQDNHAGRLYLEYDATDLTELSFKLHGSRNDHESGQAFNHTPTIPGQDGLGRALGKNETGVWPNLAVGGTVEGPCPGCDLDGYKEPDNNPHTGSMSHGDFTRDIWGANFKITSSFFNGFNITSITDYLSLSKTLITDPDGSSNPLFAWRTEQDSDDISQELRFSGDTDTMRWQAGVYYLQMDSSYASQVDLDISPYIGAPPGFAIGLTRTEWDLDVKTWAAFGQVEVDVSPELTAILGLRYTEDDKEIEAIFDDSGLGGARTLYNTDIDPKAQEDFKNLSVRAQLDWRPSDDWLFYVSYNRSHKGGNWAMPVFGMNPDPDLRVIESYPSLPHDEEILNAYEVGAKGDLWNGKARLNGSIYYYDYRDYQVFSLRNAVQTLSNRDATVSGAEIELTLNPFRGLDIILGASAMWEKTVEDVPLPTGPANRDMPMSPDYTINALVRYTWSAFSGSLAVQADAMWTDDFYFYAFNEPITFQDSYSLANARVSYTSGDEDWQIAFWVKNLTDEEYDVFKLDVAVVSYCGCQPALPRWVGGTVSYRW